MQFLPRVPLMLDIFMSDLHLGTGAPWDWCLEPERDRIVSFLKSRSNLECRIVILGDAFDAWIWPTDSVPPTMPEIFKSAFVAPVIEALGRFGDRLTIIRGNHDSTLTGSILQSVLPEARFDTEAYVVEDLYAEHGHAHAIFCAPDPDAPEDLPVGYFVSRMAAKADRDTGGHTPTRRQIIQELIDAGVSRETLPQALLDTMAARSGVGLDDTIEMPADIWNGVAISLRRVREIYAGLVHRWNHRKGSMGVWFGLAAELGVLEPSALSRGVRDTVCGHTHKAELQSVLGRTYANCGAWSNGCPTTWVEFDGRKLTLQRQEKSNAA